MGEAALPAATRQILRTKLYPPRLPAIVERGRLLEELKQARRSKLTTIVAGAGYGKTTLAVEFLQGLDCPYVWYQLGEVDCDLSVFLSYLIIGIKSKRPGFGEKTLKRIAAAANAAGQSRPILSAFISELDELIGEDLFIALDDFQAVNESPQIVEALDFLLDHMMPDLHFIVLSRSAPALDLSHLRVRRELLEISESDLCFTASEASTLFEDIFRMPLAETDIAALAETTEGWVSGLVLFYLAQKGKDPKQVSEAIRASSLYLSTVYEYFSKTAYDNQPEAVRDFIARTSILSRMSPDFCDELLDIDNSRDFFKHLMGERLFTIPLDDVGEWYRYHHGLQAFLRNILQDRYPPQEIADLHRRAASLWERLGDPEQALEHYLESGAFKMAADLLEEIGERWLAAGRVNFLDRELLRLPADILQERPKLLQTSAVTAELLGDFGRSLAAALASGEAYGRIGKQEEKARSLVLLASAMIQMGQPGEARAAIAAAYAAMPPGSHHTYTLMAAEGQLRLFQGDSGEAIRLTEEALKHIAEIEAANIKVPIYALCGGTLFFDGRIGRALEVFTNGIKMMETVDLRSHAVTFYMYMAIACAFEDRLQEANEMAEEAVALGQELELPTMIMLSRATRAFVRARMGERDGAVEDASVAADMYVQSGVIALMAVSVWLLSEAYAAIKEPADCIGQLALFKDLIKDYEDMNQFAAIVEVACTFEELGPQRAAGRVREISETIGPHGMGIVRSYAYALRFRSAVAAGEPREAVAILSDYIEEFGQDVILRPGGLDFAPVLSPFTELFAAGKHLDFMQRVYGMGGKDSLPHLRGLIAGGVPEVRTRAKALADTISRESAPPLQMCLLGRFRLGQGPREVDGNGWKSKKALTLLKYLAANRGAGFIPREVLMDLLWADVAPEAAAKSLNTALSFLRKALEPESTRGQSSYLISKGDSIFLELGSGGWTDIERFRERQTHASRAKEAGDFDLFFHTLREAEELYGGDFLSEDPYEDWCARERESLRNGYVRLLEDIATEHLRRGTGIEALECLDKVLLNDPGREDIYRRQMVICSQIGNRLGVEETFRRCDRYLKENYEVPPSAETAELYQKLRK